MPKKKKKKEARSSKNLKDELKFSAGKEPLSSGLA